MQTTASIPTVTRRVRIAFDVDVNIQPLPEKVILDAPGLAPFQQALLNDPVLCDRMVALKVIYHLLEHMGYLYPSKETLRWLPYKFIRVLKSAMRQMTVDQAAPLITAEMLRTSDLAFTAPLIDLFQVRQSNPLPTITDLDSGKPIKWQESPPASILYESTYDEYLLVKIGEENVLAVNLVNIPSIWEVIDNLLAAASELKRLGLSAHRLLVIADGDEPELPSEAQDCIQVNCSKAFPGLPVEIKTIRTQCEDEDCEDDDSEFDLCQRDF